MKKTRLIVKDQNEKIYIDTMTDLDPDHPFDVLKYVENELRPKSEELFGGEMAHLGVTDMALSGSECSSEADIDGIVGVSSSRATVIIGNQKTDNGPVTIVRDGKVVETKTRLKIHCYASGLVLDTGKTGTNFLGNRYELYFHKMTSRRMKSSSIGYAKLFSSWKDLYKTLDKYCAEFIYIVGNSPMLFSVKSVGDGVKDDPETRAMVEELIDVINGCPKDMTDDTEIPSEATPESIKAEAVHRMGTLNLYDRIVSDFKRSNKIYMSEGYGILYNLDAEGELAVTRIREQGLLPYHVVKSRLYDNTVYDVLYVSDCTDDWTVERPTKDGYVQSWCWMTAFQDSEMGEIKVESTSGGLRRIG